MRFSFVGPFFGFLLCFLTPILSLLTNIVFDNHYAIFRPWDTGLKFDLDKQIDILFLEKSEEPTLENSLYGLTIWYNRTKYANLVNVVLYKEGIQKTRNSHEIDEEGSLKNMELYWDRSGHIQISAKKFTFRATVFSWEEDAENEGHVANITYIAIKSTNSTTIRMKDTFIWISDMLQVCPSQNAYFSCDLKIGKSDLVPKDQRNSSIKQLRKIMHMKLQSKHSSSQQYYEMQILVNQTTDKVDPRLYIMKRDATKVKMDTIYGNIELVVNISARSITIAKRNDSIPLFLWRDSDEASFFHDLRYATLQLVESGASSGHIYTYDKSFVNVCKIFCNPNKELPWYSRWANKVKNVFVTNGSQDGESAANAQ